jgi:hypothetical protein
MQTEPWCDYPYACYKIAGAVGNQKSLCSIVCPELKRLPRTSTTSSLQWTFVIWWFYRSGCCSCRGLLPGARHEAFRATSQLQLTYFPAIFVTLCILLRANGAMANIAKLLRTVMDTFLHLLGVFCEQQNT